MLNKTDIEIYIKIICQLSKTFDINDSVGILSGAALVLHNLRETTADIDLQVSPKLFDKLIQLGGKRQLKCINKTILDTVSFSVYDCSYKSDCDFEYRTIDDNLVGIQTLSSLLDLKLSMNRDKDKEDIKRIKERLSLIEGELLGER